MGVEDSVEQQKFNKAGHRLVVGCIPFRKERNNKVKILMVRSQNGQHFVFPKGGWETHDKSAEDAAIREAQEEAGVQGKVRTAIGVYKFEKAKKLRNPEGTCEVHMFLLEVTQELETWPEQHRGREWIDLDKIMEIILARCRHDWMVEALKKIMEQQQEQFHHHHHHQQQISKSLNCKQISPVWDEETEEQNRNEKDHSQLSLLKMLPKTNQLIRGR